MTASLVGEKAFNVDLPVHESDATRRDFGTELVPVGRLRTPAEDIVRNLTLSADGRLLLIRVQSEKATQGTYAVDLEYLADFVAHVHASIGRGEAGDGQPPRVIGTMENGPNLRGFIVYQPPA